MDGAGNISLFNRGAQSIFGYDSWEVLGRPLDILIPPRFRDGHIEHVARFQGGSPATRMMGERGRIVGLRKNGQEFPAEASITRVPGANRPGAAIVLRDVSDRAALENDLHETARRLNAIFEQAFHFVGILKPNGAIVAINQTALDLAEWTRDAVIGRQIWDIGDFATRAEIRRELQSAVRKAARGQTAEPVTIAFGSEGRKVLELSFKAIRDDSGNITLVSAEGRDISEYIRADQRLRATQAHLVASQRIAHIGHWTWDLATGEMEWSDELYRICGRRPDALRPNLASLLDVTHPADRAALDAALNTACGGTPFAFDHRILLPDGKERIVSAQAEVAQGVDGKPANITCVLQDVTEQRRAESRLREAKHAADAANRAKSEFLNLMSHELRTPLNAIIGFSALIADAAFGPIGDHKYCEYAREIVSSGRHLLDLIDRILNLARIEAGKLEPQVGDVALDKVVERCFSTLKNEAQEAGVNLQLGEVQRLTIAADELMLSEVVFNLLSNAVRFTNGGGGVTVDITSELSTGWAVIRVADTGIGIAEEDIPRALEPFSQIVTRSIRALGGSGLGLPLAKAFVEFHGGTLSISSAPGKGTTVVVRLPQHRNTGTDRSNQTRTRTGHHMERLLQTSVR
jgi:PAS domain S-box-containing protein